MRPGGRFVAVEPWRTPFLDFFHLISAQPTVRRLWPKLDAYQTMQDNEAETFARWISAPGAILGLLRERSPRRLRHRLGEASLRGASPRDPVTGPDRDGRAGRRP